MAASAEEILSSTEEYALESPLLSADERIHERKINLDERESKHQRESKQQMDATTAKTTSPSDKLSSLKANCKKTFKYVFGRFTKIHAKLLVKNLRDDYTIADKDYDSEELRDQIRKNNSIPIIPRKSNSKTGNSEIDWGLYKHRHLVENLFARLKHFRSIATRYDKLKRNFASMLALACSFLWLPM